MSADTRHTPGPWEAARMVHEDTGEPMTPKQMGEYVENSVVKSAEESGSLDFFFVAAQTERGLRDVCHVGNGPTSPFNAHLIAAAPDLFTELRHLVRLLEPMERDGSLTVPGLATLNGARAALAKAEGGPR